MLNSNKTNFVKNILINMVLKKGLIKKLLYMAEIGRGSCFLAIQKNQKMYFLTMAFDDVFLIEIKKTFFDFWEVEEVQRAAIFCLRSVEELRRDWVRFGHYDVLK